MQRAIECSISCDYIETKCVRNGIYHEIKSKTTVEKGTDFEDFCILYLKACGLQTARPKDLPDEILTHFNLVRADRGIDLLACKSYEHGNVWYAIQCKYRVRASPRRITLPSGKSKFVSNTVSWTDLSTFYALADRTGPWEKHIVMTNCDSVNRYGRKSEKDFTIGYKTFTAFGVEEWIRSGLIKRVTCQVTGTSTEELTIEQIREIRLKRLSQTPIVS